MTYLISGKGSSNKKKIPFYGASFYILHEHGFCFYIIVLCDITITVVFIISDNSLIKRRAGMVVPLNFLKNLNSMVNCLLLCALTRRILQKTY